MKNHRDVGKPLEWPPTYRIRTHPRARGVKLKFCPLRGLSITLPLRFNMKRLPEIINEHKDWILRHSQKVHCTHQDIPPQISLLGNEWQVQSIAQLKKIKLDTCLQSLLIPKMLDLPTLKKKTTSFFKKHANSHLPKLLEQYSIETRLHYHSCKIRSQKNRWGSCSSAKSIQLNYHLIFLPSELIRYVMIHELCHTVHMNHSQAFWQLVNNHDPNWHNHRKQLKSASQYIPAGLLIL